MRRGFTMIEMMTVIGILAIISVLVVLIINPLELFKEARDAQRAGDLKSIAEAIELAQFQNLPLGAINTVYSSIPQASGACPTIEPTLATGFNYACAPDTNYRDVDGGGWIPVEFNKALGVNASKFPFIPTAKAVEGPFQQLPIDPVNSNENSLYYSYLVKGKKYELVARFESAKYQGKMTIDGGSDTNRLENGPDLTLWNTATGGNFAVGGAAVAGPDIATGLIGHWTFNEGSGSTAADSSGGGNNGTRINGPLWAVGHISAALNFDGSDDYVSVPNANSLNLGTGDFTVSTWFRKSAPDALLSGGLVSKLDPNSDFGWSLYASVPNRLKFSTRQLSWNTVEANVVINDTNWHHVVGVRSGVVVSIYIDGVHSGDNTSPYPARNVSNSEILAVGLLNSSVPGSNLFSGSIDDVRIYNRALSAADIQALYTNPIPYTCVVINNPPALATSPCW